MNKLTIIMLIACLSVTACGRQKLTQIPQPPQGKQPEILQATTPVSSSKWTRLKGGTGNWNCGVVEFYSGKEL
jgi:hypothetical protein